MIGIELAFRCIKCRLPEWSRKVTLLVCMLYIGVICWLILAYSVKFDLKSRQYQEEQVRTIYRTRPQIHARFNLLLREIFLNVIETPFCYIRTFSLPGQISYRAMLLNSMGTWQLKLLLKMPFLAVCWTTAACLFSKLVTLD